LAFYRRARDEVKHRVENKIGVVPEEKYRLLWAGGVSPWHSMYMFNYFEEKFGAVVVMDCEVDFGRPIDVEDPDPLEVMAIRAAMHEGTNRYGIQLPERLVQWIKDYKIDGVLWHLTMSCHASTEGSLLSDLVIQQHLPVPSLVLESDLIDSRAFNEAEIKARIDAFMESVAANKEKKKRG
jgi:benzoyl-CoA reductase/2-hydroxyglutaryl-CoA dehydratase subunit BcrC/BadD/HgdB